ncbi:hypothetical protein EVAR_61323_1 [Eumeta japonica]|uniref:Uncharacterized protein n=1 Tax=Eumeta variegata TaxID=151549 RepID=A0A4C1Y0Y6_EUMVA|nr:hypothetical protein EVAR_61323_1 [Eumeta japonica]
MEPFAPCFGQHRKPSAVNVNVASRTTVVDGVGFLIASVIACIVATNKIYPTPKPRLFARLLDFFPRHPPARCGKLDVHKFLDRFPSAGRSEGDTRPCTSRLRVPGAILIHEFARLHFDDERFSVSPERRSCSFRC